MLGVFIVNAFARGVDHGIIFTGLAMSKLRKYTI